MRYTCFCDFLSACCFFMVSLVAMIVLLVLKMYIVGSDSDIIPVFYVCGT